MKDMKYLIKFLFAALALSVLGACSSPLEPSLPRETGAAPGFVRISIGEQAAMTGIAQGRTLQPTSAAIAGYQLTFACGSGTHEPVNLQGGVSYADVSLTDGTWTITATAYLLGNDIGDEDDKIASGSISVTVSGGAVAGGSVPTIILKAIEDDYDYYESSLRYMISVASGVTGTLTLRNIDGTPKTDELNNSVLNFWALGEDIVYNDVIGLYQGRYIIEARLSREDGKIAFRREIVETWKYTTTEFMFAPTEAEYLDTDQGLASANAVISEEDSFIGGVAIGNGTGSGASEADPRIYTVSPRDMGNVTGFNLVPGADSLFFTSSWARNTGVAPGGVYSSEALPSDFTSDNVLWIKAVSEDGSTTMYYKFIFSLSLPRNGVFTDTNYNAGKIGGTISWDKPADDYYVIAYHIYYGSDETTKVRMALAYPEIPLGTTTQIVGADTEVPPEGTRFFLVYSYDGTKDSAACLAIPIVDSAVGGTMGSFTVSGTAVDGVSYSSAILTINKSGRYYITGTGAVTTDRIRVAGSNIDVDIVLENVNINASGAPAFDANADNLEGVNVNITLEGTNTLKSNSIGLRVPSNGNLLITEASTGSLTVTGGSAGIGDANFGTITINGGIITANGGDGAAGIGGGYNGGYGSYGSGVTITINGGTVTATCSGNGAGIGGGDAVNITGGTVIASSSNGAGIYIGDGYGGSDGMINISGGTITAIGSVAYDGIGIYGDSTTISGGIITARGTAVGIEGIFITIESDAVVFASSIRHSYNGYSDGVTDIRNGLVFTGDAGTVYGNVTLPGDVTFTPEMYLTVDGGNTLTIPSGVTLTNNGTIGIDGGVIVGTVSGNQPVRAAFTVSGGTAYEYTKGILTITGDGTYTVEMASGSKTDANRIVIAPSVNANVTLSNVNIDLSMSRLFSGVSAFDMTGATVNLTLVGDNLLNGGQNSAGLKVPEGSTLTVNGVGTLTIVKDRFGAGIGGSSYESGGTITIESGTITIENRIVYPYDTYGAGIGGGYGGSGGVIKITGGIVTSSGGSDGAGIGGGYGASGGTITIEGGTVNARGTFGAGIGGGNGYNATYEAGGDGGTINITNGTITAVSGSGAGIGGGYFGDGGAISITGGVTSSGGSDGAGIGGGSYGDGGAISITGGIVTARSGSSGAAGIGSGKYGTSGTITALNNAVVFASSIQPTLTEGVNLNDAIVFIGNGGTLYGDFTLANDVTFDAGKTLSIASGKSLTIPSTVTLTNNGTINNQGTIIGTVSGNQPVTMP